MTTPKRIIVDLATSTITEVELQGEELEAYNASLEAQRLEELNKQLVTQEQVK